MVAVSWARFVRREKKIWSLQIGFCGTEELKNMTSCQMSWGTQIISLYRRWSKNSCVLFVPFACECQGHVTCKSVLLVWKVLIMWSIQKVNTIIKCSSIWLVLAVNILGVSQKYVQTFFTNICPHETNEPAPSTHPPKLQGSFKHQNFRPCCDVCSETLSLPVAVEPPASFCPRPPQLDACKPAGRTEPLSESWADLHSILHCNGMLVPVMQVRTTQKIFIL